jgi:hypothetical protein
MSAAAACTVVVLKGMQTIAATMNVLVLLFIVVASGVDRRPSADTQSAIIPHGERIASPTVGAGEFQFVPQRAAAATLSKHGGSSHRV